MKTFYQFISSALLALVWIDGNAAASEVTSDAEQPAVWQGHHAEFDYFGLTTRYTCDGLEQKVGQILVYLGARPDVRVNATGCPRGPNSVSRSAFVRADFSTLVAAANASAEAQTVAADWTALTLTAQRPLFMGDGDCELIDRMRKVLKENFSWRGDVAYHADCPIQSTQLHDFEIRGEVLKAKAPNAH
jgi:hypothetical protein